MIPHGVEIFLSVDPIDLRWGFDRLAGLVSERLGRSARTGALFVFFGRRREAIKVLFFDGSGLCLFYKRLSRDYFRYWPGSGDGSVAPLLAHELQVLLMNGDPKATRAAPPWRPLLLPTGATLP